MSTAYLIVRGEYTTLSVPVGLLVDATPGNEITAPYDSGDGLPGPGHTGGHVSAPFRSRLSLIYACNTMLSTGYFAGGYRLVELSFTTPDDVAGCTFDGAGAYYLWLNRADVVAEIDAATIEATATIPPAAWRVAA
jgi:hypothetical protein